MDYLQLKSNHQVYNIEGNCHIKTYLGQYHRRHHIVSKQGETKGYNGTQTKEVV